MNEPPFITKDDITTAVDAVYPHVVNLSNLIEEFNSVLRLVAADTDVLESALQGFLYDLETRRE